MAKEADPPITPAEAQQLDRAKAFIEEHAVDGIRMLAAALVAGMSLFHFTRRFRARFGRTPKQVATASQIEHAKRLLLEGVPGADVSRRCGFGHQSNFGTRFKQIVGATPSRWLREQRRRTAPDAARQGRKARARKRKS